MCAFGWGEKGEDRNRGKKKREESKIFNSLARKKMLGIGIFHPFGSFQVGVENMTVGNEIMKLHTHTLSPSFQTTIRAQY